MSRYQKPPDQPTSKTWYILLSKFYSRFVSLYKLILLHFSFALEPWGIDITKTKPPKRKGWSMLAPTSSKLPVAGYIPVLPVRSLRLALQLYVLLLSSGAALPNCRYYTFAFYTSFLKNACIISSVFTMSSIPSPSAP